MRNCWHCWTSFTDRYAHFCSPECRATAQGERTRERLFSYTRPENGCLVWTGRRDRDGYGVIWVTEQQTTRRASRVMWEAVNGPIGRGMFVCHRCDNPPCVDLDHLFLGTSQDNVADRHRKGRDARGERQHLARLTSADVRGIRRLAEAGATPYRISQDLGLPTSTVWNVVRGHSWSWLPQEEAAS